MSDYNPDPRHTDPSRDYDYADSGSNRAGYVLLAVLAGVALVGGYLYFSSPQLHNDQQAQMPDRTMTAPAPETPALPGGNAPPMRDAPAPQAPVPPAPQPQE